MKTNCNCIGIPNDTWDTSADLHAPSCARRSEDNRAIDCLVAEHVFKLTPKRITVNWYPHEITLFYPQNSQLIEYSWDKNSCNAMMYRNGKDDRDGVALPLPFYSCEIDPAWEVVETMKDNRHFRDRLYAADFLSLSSMDAPMVICLAALEVL